MKKILFGLISVSMISFAAQPAISGDAAENTPVFQTGQTGKIPVKGSLSSQAIEIKYVVFASDSEAYNPDGATWDLPPFYVSATVTDLSKVAFAGVTPPKLYVRRVNGSNNGITDLAPNETVYFKIKLEPAMTDRIYDWIKAGGKTPDIRVTAFLGNTTLEKIASKVGASVNKTAGTLYEGSVSSGRFYLPKYGMSFSSKSNGVFEVTHGTVTSTTTPMSSAMNKKIETALASGFEFAEVSIGVKVE